MSILDKIITIKPTAPRITLYGNPGIGKSTLANQFPDPLFILTEDNKLVNCKALPIALSFEEIWETVTELNKLEILPFKTIVIDSISKLDNLIIDYVLKHSPLDKNDEPVKTIAQAFGGYGAGFMRASSLHKSFKAKLDKLNERGITIIFISHTEIRKCKLPDQEDYDFFSIVMNSDASRAVYINDVDLVGFCKIKSHVTSVGTKDKKRNLIKSTNNRIISVNINDVHVSKNRYNMPEELPMTFNDIAQYIPFYGIDNNE